MEQISGTLLNQNKPNKRFWILVSHPVYRVTFYSLQLCGCSGCDVARGQPEVAAQAPRVASGSHPGERLNSG